jgi:RHS repeat-associated protein
VTGQGSLTLGWDARNRLATASTTGAAAVSESYLYDGLGRRIAKVSNGVRTDYLYDGADIVAEYRGGDWSAPSVRYVHGAGTDEVLERIASVNGMAQAAEYYAADGLGSVVALARADGSQLRGTLRDAWGRAVYNIPGSPLPLGYGYTGREHDATGLVYYRARYYDAAFGNVQSGAFVSRDPIGIAGGINDYAYVGNNPVNATDPSGLVARSVGNGAAHTFTSTVSYWASDRPSQEGVYRTVGENLPFVGGGYTAYNTLSSSESSALDRTLAVASIIPTVKWTSTVTKVVGSLVESIGALRSAGKRDAHHIIQDAAVRDLPGYNSNSAPGIQLPGPSNSVGTPHNLAGTVQRQSGGGTYAAERRIGYKALRRAGINREDARSAIHRADEYFEGIGVGPDTVTRMPGNRPSGSR